MYQNIARFLLRSTLIIVFLMANGCTVQNSIVKTTNPKPTLTRKISSQNSNKIKEPTETQKIVSQKVSTQSTHLPESKSNNSNDLTPFFLFNKNETYIIDYEKGQYSIKNKNYSINKDYMVNNWGIPTIYDVVTGERLFTISDLNCEVDPYNFLIGDYLINRCGFHDDNPNSEKIQAWDLSKNAYIGEIPLTYNGFYVNFAASPDNTHFLLSGLEAYARLFSIDPFQEISMQANRGLIQDLFSSPDKEYIISDNRALWKWTGNDVELIESIPELSASHEILSVSSEADYIVYLYHHLEHKAIPSTLIVKDRKTNIEVLNISQNDPIFSGLEIRDSAISHDGYTLLVSTSKNLSVGTIGKFEYYLFVIQTKTGKVLHQFGPLSGPIPQRLRVEYLPETIRDTWVWENYK